MSELRNIPAQYTRPKEGVHNEILRIFGRLHEEAWLGQSGA